MYLISSLERARVLDRLAGPAQRAARLLPPGKVRDTLHGVWLGHPLHPVLAQAPVGTWLSASLLDAWPGSSPGTAAASRRLVLAGLAAALPAALAGSADWSEMHEQQMRVGVVHALANTAAVALYAASLAAPDRAARGLRLAGLTAVAAGGMLGGHLAFRQSAGANQAEPVPHLTEPGWHDLMTAAELAGLAAGQSARRALGDVPVVVVRDEQGVYVLAERCSHLSGPLSEGDYRDGCLTCPWHGSTFRVSDGGVARGPATAPQPAFRTRIADGNLQASLPGAG
jgi:nitrite reductase/ring-hydroxylating ferredoxin subunit